MMSGLSQLADILGKTVRQVSTNSGVAGRAKALDQVIREKAEAGDPMFRKLHEAIEEAHAKSDYPIFGSDNIEASQALCDLLMDENKISPSEYDTEILVDLVNEYVNANTQGQSLRDYILKTPGEFVVELNQAVSVKKAELLMDYLGQLKSFGYLQEFPEESALINHHIQGFSALLIGEMPDLQNNNLNDLLQTVSENEKKTINLIMDGVLNNCQHNFNPKLLSHDLRAETALRVYQDCLPRDRSLIALVALDRIRHETYAKERGPNYALKLLGNLTSFLTRMERDLTPLD